MFYSRRITETEPDNGNIKDLDIVTYIASYAPFMKPERPLPDHMSPQENFVYN
jgi:hypothetical protein